MSQRLTQDEIDARIASLAPGWSGSPEALRRTIEFADFLTAVRFVDGIAPRCEELNHHPDLTLSWRRVTVSLSTHSAGGVTDKDAQLAAAVDEVAGGLPLAG